MRFLVLGGGQQGSAAAFDLCRNGEPVILADQEIDGLEPFLQPFRGGPLDPRKVDATDRDAVAELMGEVDAVLCALPYYFNLPMTRLAIEAGVHFCDLGGNTGIVEDQKALDARARRADVSVVPDCGLAPGMVNILAQTGIDALDETESVRIWVGGLPQDPQPPLGYHIVYSVEGVLDYYTTDALVLEDGEPTYVEALTGLETAEFPDPVGELEAFYTGGGISMLPFRHRGEIREMVYKTLRYPGHARIMRAIRDLGLLDTEPLDVGGCRVAPRELFIEKVGPRLRDPDARDLVVLRVEVSGTDEGVEKTIRWDLLDRYDEEEGLTAMMRTTGFSLAVTALMQADGRIDRRGVHTPDECVPSRVYVDALADRGVHIERTDF